MSRGLPAFASVELPELEALLDLSMRLGQIDERLQMFEQALADAGDPLAEVMARIDALDARLTTLERRQRRPPPFAVTLIYNETRKPEPVAPAEPHPLVEKIWQRLIDEQIDQRLKPVFGNLHQQAAQFAMMRDRIAVVEARTAATKE
jgi:hypothetical protein